MIRAESVSTHMTAAPAGPSNLPITVGDPGADITQAAPPAVVAGAEEVRLRIGWRMLGTVVLWLGLNLLLAIYLKWLLTDGGLPLPVLLSMVQQVPGCVAVVVMLCVHRRRHGSLADHAVVRLWREIICCSACFSVSICLGNAGLQRIHVATTLMLKTGAPVLQLATSWVIERKFYSSQAMLTVPLVVGGAALGSVASPDLDALGYAYTVASMLFMVTAQLLHHAVTRATRSPPTPSPQVMYNSFSAVLLQKRGVSALDAWLHTSFYSAALMVPAAALLEGAYLAGHFNAVGWRSLAIHLPLSALVAGAFQVNNFHLLKLTSSVYNCMLGLVKMVLISAVAYVVQPMAVPPVRYVGFGMALLGFVLFNYCAREPPLVDCDKGGEGGGEGGGDGYRLCLCGLRARPPPCFLCVARRGKPTERTALISS